MTTRQMIGFVNVAFNAAVRTRASCAGPIVSVVNNCNCCVGFVAPPASSRKIRFGPHLPLIKLDLPAAIDK